MRLPADIPHGRSVPLPVIRYHVLSVLQHARRDPSLTITVEAAKWGHPARVVAPMFDYAPPNVHLPYEFMY